MVQSARLQNPGVWTEPKHVDRTQACGQNPSMWTEPKHVDRTQACEPKHVDRTQECGSGPSRNASVAAQLVRCGTQACGSGPFRNPPVVALRNPGMRVGSFIGCGVAEPKHAGRARPEIHRLWRNKSVVGLRTMFTTSSQQ
jgi:hypothetical protein